MWVFFFCSKHSSDCDETEQACGPYCKQLKWITNELQNNASHCLWGMRYDIPWTLVRIRTVGYYTWENKWNGVEHSSIDRSVLFDNERGICLVAMNGFSRRNFYVHFPHIGNIIHSNAHVAGASFISRNVWIKLCRCVSCDESHVPCSHIEIHYWGYDNEVSL